MDTSGPVTQIELSGRDHSGSDWQADLTLHEGATHWVLEGVARNLSTGREKPVSGSLDLSRSPTVAEAGFDAWVQSQINTKLPGATAWTVEFADPDVIVVGPSSRAKATEPDRAVPSAEPPVPAEPGDGGEASVTAAHRASLTEPATVASASPSIDADLDLDASVIAASAAKSAVLGLVALGVGVAAGPLVGAGILGGLFLSNFLTRYADAVASGSREGAAGRAAVAGVSDLVPGSVVELMEAAYGVDYMSGRVLSNTERSVRIGNLAGGLAGGMRPRGPGPVVGGQAAPPRLRDMGSPAKRRVRRLTGKDERDLQYSRGEGDWQIYSYRTAKNTLAGRDTGMEANHLIPGEWFEKGPSHLRGLYDFVPSVPLMKGAEHQGTFHGRGVNPEVTSWELYKQPTYTQADIERGMDGLIVLYGRRQPEFTRAVREFRREIFDKVKQ